MKDIRKPITNGIKVKRTKTMTYGLIKAKARRACLLLLLFISFFLTFTP